MSEEDKAARKLADWESIERDYRAGVMSLREIGKVHGVSDTAIRKKAKACGWERDLTDKVNEKVRTELVRSEVRISDPQTERQIIETAAATVVQVVRGHRKKITRQIELVEILTEQLVGAAGNRDDIADEVFADTADDENGKRRAAMLKAVSISSHTSAVVNLSNALKTLIGLERQAFNIKGDEDGPTANPLADLMKQVAGKTLKPVATPEGDD